MVGLIFVDVSVPSSLLSVLIYDSDGRQGDQLSTNGGTGNLYCCCLLLIFGSFKIAHTVTDEQGTDGNK